MKSLSALLLLLTLGCSEKQIYESETTAVLASQATLAASPNAAYEKYIGVYKMQGASFEQVTITQQDGKLFVEATGEKKVEIYPQKENTFQVPAFNATLTFNQEADSTFSAITVWLGGNELKGKRK